MYLEGYLKMWIILKKIDLICNLFVYLWLIWGNIVLIIGNVLFGKVVLKYNKILGNSK